MKLIHATKTGKYYRLNDNRIGAIFNSGYVRVSVKFNTIKPEINQCRFYQINKKVEVNYTNHAFPNYERVLIETEGKRIEHLQQFELNNCK